LGADHLELDFNLPITASIQTMPTHTTNKQKIVSQLFTGLGKHVKAKPPDARPVLEQFVYAMLRENATHEAADQAFTNLQERFYDWNEVRVSSTLEIVEALDGALGDAETRAQRIVDFLQEIFETTYSFDLEPLLEVLQKKGLKQASKQLLRYQAANDYAVAWVVQHSLGGHAIPLDSSAMRVLKRMGLIEDQNDMEALRASVEHLVPKAKGSQFVDLLSVLAEMYCHEDEPACAQCGLRSVCPTGQEAKAAVAAAATSKKPR
jgi:endonuclease III